MRLIALLFLLLAPLFAQPTTPPKKQLKAVAHVTDIVFKDGKLYAATTAGEIDIFNVKENKIIHRIKIDKIRDFMGDSVDAKIYSVDVLDNKTVLLSQADGGYRAISIYQNSQLVPLITAKDRLSIAKAKFLDAQNVIFALLSNDIISYNIKEKKQNWKIQASMSKFSNFALSEDRSKIVIADESGDLHLIDTKSGKIIQTLAGENLDNVFCVDYKSNIIVTAGKDRRAVIYNLTLHAAYYKTSSFLIYAAGLSPSAKFAAYSSNEKNDITVFKTDTKSNIGIFGSIAMTTTQILFINENEFFVASDDKVINFYQIH